MVGKLAIGIVLAVFIWNVATRPETRVFAKADTQTATLGKKMDKNPSSPESPRTEPLSAPLKDSTEVEEKLVQPSIPIDPPISTPEHTNPVKNVSLDGPDFVWQRLIDHGFSREQVAGIMGNLRQEHNFQTSDVPGGLGIAQWMSNRRAALMAKPNYLDLAVQVDFIVEEMNSTEHRAGAMLRAATTVEAATIAFQDGYERCGDCRQAQRVQYAQEYYNRY